MDVFLLFWRGLSRFCFFWVARERGILMCGAIQQAALTFPPLPHSLASSIGQPLVSLLGVVCYFLALFNFYF